MKILHTADWHIGKIVNGVHMTSDQEYVLNKLIKIIEEEKIDVLVIAGDVYDRAIPSVEAVELLDKVFNKILLELNVNIITIAGNHDSADRLSFANKILKDKGLYIEGKLKNEIEKIVLEDEYGLVNFYLIPYADPAEVREIFKDDEIKTHDDAMKAVINKIKINTEERNIAVAHGYITGVEKLEESDSERPLSIGGTDYINVDYFKAFNYTALGHLHGRQSVHYDNVMYSGSILKYSFSEVNHNKGVTIVELGEDGQVTTKVRELKPIRNMRKIKGKLNKLIAPEVYLEANAEDYLHVILTDEGELIEPMQKLKEVYPNVLSLERQSVNNEKEIAISAEERTKKKNMLELFKDFYVSITENEFTEEKENVIKEVITRIEKLERAK